MVLSVRSAVAGILRIPVTVIIGNVIVVGIVLQLWIFSIEKHNSNAFAKMRLYKIW